LGDRTHEPISLQKLNKKCECSNLQTTPNLLYTLLGAGIFKLNYMSKDFSFSRFFHADKSTSKNGSGIHQAEKRHGRLVWDSSKKGTYVRAIHGELK